jgi:putative SOS response-associated peptidase YedK
MCGRFALITDLTKIAERFNIRKSLVDVKAGWNISPGQHIAAVVQQNGQNIIESFLWGLIPSWAKDPSIGHKLINARAETIGEKPSFRAAFKKRRCLIIVDGFYEWKTDGKKKIPLYFYFKSGEPFALAGLHESWISPEQKQVNTCTIITTDANSLISPIHDRMPVIVHKEQEHTWINESIEDKSVLLSILKPYPAEEMDYKTGMGPKFTEDK